MVSRQPSESDSEDQPLACYCHEGTITHNNYEVASQSGGFVGLRGTQCITQVPSRTCGSIIQEATLLFSFCKNQGRDLRGPSLFVQSIFEGWVYVGLGWVYGLKFRVRSEQVLV